MKKILVTGAAGYIGSVITRQLLFKGYSVCGLDIIKFGDLSLQEIYKDSNFEFVKGDIRDKDILKKCLTGVYGVVHLAAIVGDPACSKEPDIAKTTNRDGSRLLYDLCNQTHTVKKFLFASTCSNYGKMKGEGYMNEESPLNPISLYAELKVGFEQYILTKDKRSNFIPTILRFSTVYGISPRLRLDLTVNEFTKDAYLDKKLTIYGEQFWRPYCHVSDIARACLMVLEERDMSNLDKQVYGVGDTSENYQKQMIAHEIQKVLPDTEIEYVQKDEDPRDYKVYFSKIQKRLHFKITKTVPDGIREIITILKDGSIQDPNASYYRNI